MMLAVSEAPEGYLAYKALIVLLELILREEVRLG
jgi:hypothetical protein